LEAFALFQSFFCCPACTPSHFLTLAPVYMLQGTISVLYL
jgi:hypothetical protein